MLTINGPRLLDDLHALGRIGATGAGGVSRPALSAADMAARAWFERRIAEAGLEYRQDGAGNQSAMLPAADPGAQTLLFGSHLDTVPDGGRYDGALGTLAALEALRTIQEAGRDFPVHLEVISFTDEEGANISLLGSRALAGGLTPDDLASPHNGAEAFAANLARAGLTPAGILSARRPPDSLLAFVETHIEQGTRLERSGTDIGVVTAIVGIRSCWLTFTGEAAHAGTKPLTERRDALWGAADFIRRARDLVVERFLPGTMNCGLIQAAPGAFNIVPGEARLALEFRHPTAARLDEMEAALFALGRQIAATYGLALDITSSGNVPPTPLDESVMAANAWAADRLGLTHTRLVSFAGHDTMAMAAIAPAAMFFVPSVEGVSHQPREATRDADVIHAANVLLHTVLRLAESGR